ncbi:MAG: ribonuclease HIII [bacterium]|nr:ribonuclease HIII [bacterium]
MSDYIAGVDESGKGDYFGPLVIAAAAVGDLEKPILMDLYVRDSKKMTDSRILTVARTIKEQVPHDLVVVMPDRYNDLYQKIGNLNKLLAWGHARAIENLLGKVECATVISDQFANANVLERALMEKGRKVELIQQVRGESELAVATASVLARAEFLIAMDRLSREFDLTLPKGGGSLVDTAGVKFIRKHGVEAMRRVAKLHFKNTMKINEQLERTTKSN